MPCYYPRTAWQRTDGSIAFAERGNVTRELTLPCGQCIGCRLERSRSWAIRCMHESAMHRDNIFATLTYSPEHLPSNLSLDYRHFQTFMKRLRRRSPQPVRFYMCGEYGEQHHRPHYHALLFGLELPDLLPYTQTEQGHTIEHSELLTNTWGLGQVMVGQVNYATAYYVARYSIKKQTGLSAGKHYRLADDTTGEIHDVRPEFANMSRRPGIGIPWLKRYHLDVYPNGTVRDHGIPLKPPRLYDKYFQTLDPDAFEGLQHERTTRAIKHSSEGTALRLDTKATVARSRLNALKQRNLE